MVSVSFLKSSWYYFLLDAVFLKKVAPVKVKFKINEIFGILGVKYKRDKTTNNFTNHI
jgi:hypothetical protein